MWDVKSAQVQGAPVRFDGLIGSHIVSPDGSKAASSGWDNRVRLWDLATRRMIAIVNGEFVYFKMPRFSPDGGKLFTATYNAVHVWHTATGKELTAPLQ